MLVSWFVFCFLIREAYKLINCVDKMRRSVLFSLKVGAALDENPRCLSCFALTSYHPPPFLLTFFSFSYSLLCLAGYASVVIPLSFYLPLSLPPSVSLLCLSVVSLFLPACFTSLSPLFSPSVFIFHHLWIVCTLLFLWSLNIFFGSLVLGFLSLCVMLLPCIPLFSLVFFIPCDQFLCQLVFANPWPQCSSIFSSFSSLHKPITSLCNTQNPSCFLCADTLAHV